MTIEGLVIQEALRHIRDVGFVKHMEPYALHILKTSESPVLVEFRHWMRYEAEQTRQWAQRGQKRMNDEFAHTSYKNGNIRRSAVIHPYFAAKAVQNGDSWSDKKFVGRVKRDNPNCFPKRDCT